MKPNEVVHASGSNYLCWTGRILALAVAVFWLWWGVGSAYYEGFSWGSLLAHSAPGLLILIATLVAWKWELIGGSLLLGVGLLLTGFLAWIVFFRAGFRPATVMTWLTLALPPLLAGTLLLASRHREGE